MGTKLWTTQKSGFCKSLGGLTVAAVGMLVLISAQFAFADVDPPGCSTNGLDIDISPSATLVSHGDVITYVVCFDNVGATNCNDTEVNSSLVLPDGSSILLLDGDSIDAGDAFCCPGDARCDDPVGPYSYTVAHVDETGPVSGCPPTETSGPPPSIVSAYASFSGTVHISTVDLPGSAEGCKTAPAIVQHACCHPCNGTCTDVPDAATCAALFVGGIFTADKSCSEVECPDPCNECEVCNDATGQCDPDDPCNACEQCNPATGNCDDISDCNACEQCNPATGACDDISDCNACEECNPVTGACEQNVSCDDCDECDTNTGQCVAIDPPPPGCVAGEGCTPGYWKLIDVSNGHASHECNWADPYTPGTMFCAVFDCSGGSEFNGMTLIEVLRQGGGGHKALGRHTVAALLNAASDGVFYLFSADDVISMFNATWPCSGNACNGLKRTFAEQNEGIDLHCCPLGVCKCGDNGRHCDADGSQCDDSDTCGGRVEDFVCEEE